MLWTIHQRGALTNFMKALDAKKCTVAYFGGSITDGAKDHNWPHFVDHWMVSQFPEVRFFVENIALGATGSDIGLMRCDRDVLSKNPDLCLIEFAVNDNGFDPEFRERTREGLLRKVLASGKADAIVVYTFTRDFQYDMEKGEMPKSISDFEKLCEHYQVPSVWMSARNFEMLQKGLIRIDEWLPDYLHPQYAGARQYAEAVCELLKLETEKENPSEILMGDKLPKPLNPKNYGNLKLLSWDNVTWKGPVYIERSQRLAAVEELLTSSALGCGITVSFEGTGLLMAEIFGSDTCEYTISIDGGEPFMTDRERPEWAGKQEWPLRSDVICENLPCGKHTVTLRTEFGRRPEVTNLLMRIGMFAVV